MKLYLIYQQENTGYDTYDSAVMCAEDEEIARDMHPSDGHPTKWEEIESWNDMWATKRENVVVKYIGEAEEGSERGCVCSSFNAG